LRAISKYVAEVRIATRAHDLVADHAMTGVLPNFDIIAG
jgi:hypothetical protein